MFAPNDLLPELKVGPFSVQAITPTLEKGRIFSLCKTVTNQRYEMLDSFVIFTPDFNAVVVVHSIRQGDPNFLLVIQGIRPLVTDSLVRLMLP